MRTLLLALAATTLSAQVSKVWTDDALARLEVPLAQAEYSPKHISSGDYYRIPARTIYRAYPVYHPDREPRGYWEWLHRREPEVAFVDGLERAHEEWVAAGERVFNAGTSFGPVFFGADDVRDRNFYEETEMPVAADGTIPFATWVIREKGKVELASMGCNTCHTRVLPDGRVAPGAQGNNPGDRQGARLLERGARFLGVEKMLKQARTFALQFELPWLDDDFNQRARTASLEELIAAGRAIPPGVTARAFTSMYAPPQIPDLIGVRDRKFLDHTGLVRHNEPADLMRYSSLVQDMMGYARYGDFPPIREPQPGKGARYSDEQLHALTTYLYSLEPPENPNQPDARSNRGREVFERERCSTCHTPPLYTNNKLIPVDGFNPADAEWVMKRRIGLDPRTALATKKGTGYYKVPSLLGVWYRGPFEHNGRAATLEEWFDPEREAPGHPFGVKLAAKDKQALIAFLRTL